MIPAAANEVRWRGAVGPVRKGPGLHGYSSLIHLPMITLLRGRNIMRRALTVLLVAGGVGLGPGTIRAQQGLYRFAQDIAIGGEGGWDYLTVDAPAHRLYVSHATKVVAVDTQTNKVVGEIADTPGVHGIALAPDLGRGFTSNGRENKVSIVDLKTLKTIQKVA